MTKRYFAAWFVALAVSGVGPPAIAEQPNLAARSDPVVAAAEWMHATRVSEFELATVYGAGLQAPTPKITPKGVAVILWDERTKVRMTDNGVGSASPGQTINVTVTQR